MSTDALVTLNGPTMGTRWSVRLASRHASEDLTAALQDAVNAVERQMSTWRPDSDLMRLNTATPGAWVDVGAELIEVLGIAAEVTATSGGAFDIGVGEAVTAWGFGPAQGRADEAAIRTALGRQLRAEVESDPGMGRARRQGWVSAVGQLGTMVLTRLGKRFLAGHAERLIAEEKLATEPRQGQTIIHVPSANGPECLKEIASIGPGVVLLAGCRLLSKDMLAGMPCPVLNYHAGIAPKYRGMNGGYWALAEGDVDNAGVTVHLVNTGIDTGGVVYQSRIHPAPEDNFITYPALQVAAGVRLMKQAVRDALNGMLHVQQPDLPSRLYYLPTIWQYWWTRLRTGVR